MVKPNEMQVGGAHYNNDADYQHWDMVSSLFGPGYLVGCITKYIYRCFKKNGSQDLEKALHYIAKLRELYPTYPRKVSYKGAMSYLPKDAMKAYTKLIAGDPGVTPDQTLAMQFVIEGNLDRAERVIREGLIPALTA